MKKRDLLASLALHAAAVAAAFAVMSLFTGEDEQGEVMYFEIVEEAAEAEVSAERPAPAEDMRELPPEMPRQDQPHPESEHAPALAPPPPEEAPPAPDALQDDDSRHEDAPPDDAAENAPEENHAEKTEDAPAPMAEAPASAPSAANEERARVVSSPQALGKIVPAYPRSARRRGHEGEVSVEVAVSESGLVSDASVVSSSGHGELDAAALDAARSANFAPAMEDGAAVPGRLKLRFDFRLQDGGGR